MPNHALAINKVRIRATKQDADWILHDLQNAGWGVVEPQAWVFVRSVGVRGEKSRIRQQASQAVSSAVDRAADGRLAGAEGADAVRFQHFAELLVFLLRDLIAGDAARRWYWQRWAALFAEPPRSAVTRLLWENAEYLPELVQQLSVYGQLASVWHCLDSRGGGQVLERLCQITSMSLPDLNAPSNRHKTTQTSDRAVILPNDPSLFLPWSTVLGELPITDRRWPLAATAVGLGRFPVTLMRDPQIAFERFVARVKTNAGLAAGLRLGQESQDLEASTFALSSRDDATAAPTQAMPPSSPKAKPIEPLTFDDTAAPLNTDSIVPAKQSIIAKPSVHGKADRQPSGGKSMALTGSQEVGEDNTTPQNTTSAQSIETPSITYGGDRFITQQGGFFYLINALTLSDCLDELIRESRHTSGWLWLYDLLRLFNAQADDGLIQFIARQTGFDDPAELQTQPPCPVVKKTFNELARRFEARELWQADLLNIPAAVTSTASHVDVFYHLAAVRLPVRLAALDVNPGWVPWLGRVIALHYRESIDGGTL